jgi:hypothetical protein
MPAPKKTVSKRAVADRIAMAKKVTKKHARKPRAYSPDTEKPAKGVQPNLLSELMKYIDGKFDERLGSQDRVQAAHHAVNVLFSDDAGERGPDVLAKAKDIIYGDREKTYGTPGFNLESIAQLWTVYLKRRNPACEMLDPLTKADVCQLMILLKTARLINNQGHLDSLVDQCGYAALQERVQ